MPERLLIEFPEMRVVYPERQVLRDTFIGLSRSAALRRLAERSSLGSKLSRRFVAGTTREEGLHAALQVNAAGMPVSMDNLGENVATAQEAEESAALYHQLLDEIAARGVNGNVSLKLTQMGLDFDEGLARKLVSDLVAHAGRGKNFVRVDMEGSAYTQTTLDFVRQIHAIPGNAGHVGAVIQAYLHRSEKDIEELLSHGIRIRLCKGAYKEPASLAFPGKAEVDANYVKLMKILLKSGVFHGIATHDEAMIRATVDFARQENIPRESFEFQMLYGVRRDLQKQLSSQGYGMRVYIPFGAGWYAYFMRRLAERPANALFVARNLLRR